MYICIYVCIIIYVLQVRLREWVPTGNNQKTCRVQSHGIWEDGTCWVRRQSLVARR